MTEFSFKAAVDAIRKDSYREGYEAGINAERQRLLSLTEQLYKRVRIVRETARLGSIHDRSIREHWANELQSIADTICARLEKETE